MAERTGADLFVDALTEYGVTHVFGNPGTTELPLVRAVSESHLEYVLGLHEDIAVGMAGGYASTRRYHAFRDDEVQPVGVVNLHLTPGVAHGIGNLYNAAMGGVPLVVTAGNHSRDFRHEEPVLSGDQIPLTEQFTKWSDEVRDVEALPVMLRRAFRVALTPPTGPVFLSLPLDVMRATTDTEVQRLGDIPQYGSGGPDDRERALSLLERADAPVLVVGDGVARAGPDAIQAAVAFAEATGARVQGGILASEIGFPPSHEQWVSHLPPDEGILQQLWSTDLVVFAGTGSQTTLTRHDEPLLDPSVDTIHLGEDVWELGKNYRADATVIGNPGAILGELADAAASRIDSEERQRRMERVTAIRQMVEQKLAGGDAADESDLASKAAVVDAMRAEAPDALLVDESVTAKYDLLTRWDLEPEQFISNKGNGLGYGLPASVGASLAESMRDDPRTVLGFVGDGSYLYYPNAIYTAARRDLDLTVVVPDNRNYRILKENAGDLFEEAPDDVNLTGVDFDPAVDIAANAESHGATGRLVEDPSVLEDELRDAIEEAGPTVLDVLVHD